MELKITKEEQNPLFDRKEIIATLDAESVPRRQEVSELLSKKYSVPNNALRILDIKGKFGVKEFTIRAHIYPSNEERDKYEKLTKKEKQAEKPKLEEKPTEAPPEPEGKAEVKTPAEEAIGINPVEEAKKVEEKREEEDKKEKDKSKEEKLNETELQA